MTEILVPPLGESVSSATVARWLKKAGEAVTADEPLVELETDKVTVEVNAPSAGVIEAIAAGEGAEVGPGAVLGTIAAGAAAAAVAPPPPAPVKAAPPVEAPRAPSGPVSRPGEAQAGAPAGAAGFARKASTSPFVTRPSLPLPGPTCPAVTPASAIAFVAAGPLGSAAPACALRCRSAST